MLLPRGLHNAFLFPLSLMPALGLKKEGKKPRSNIYKLIRQRPDLNITGVSEKCWLGWEHGAFC